MTVVPPTLAGYAEVFVARIIPSAYSNEQGDFVESIQVLNIYDLLGKDRTLALHAACCGCLLPPPQLIRCGSFRRQAIFTLASHRLSTTPPDRTAAPRGDERTFDDVSLLSRGQSHPPSSRRGSVSPSTATTPTTLTTTACFTFWVWLGWSLLTGMEQDK